MKKKSSKRSEGLLKIDLHTHTADDPIEKIGHSGKDLIDKACDLGFDAISITNHSAVSYNGDLRDYACDRSIVLIPGAELKIEGKHVLIVNGPEEIVRAQTFDDLRRLRSPESLIIAPHPYFPGFSSLLWMMRRHMDLFDAIEFSWFYHRHINFNRFALRAADTYGLPLVCTSDCHHLERFGLTYSLVEAEKNAESIIEAVKAGRVEIVANPLKFVELSKHGIEHVASVTMGMVRNLVVGGDTR